MKVKNPILTGFNPDPCICKANDTYYLATSTFEYFPGINIYESKDLANWNLITSPLNTVELLDMNGNSPSSGVWAPDLTFVDDTFYIVYSNMKHVSGGPFKDCQNFIIKSKSIYGPWSKPVYFNSTGFDASLFHDEDGKSYFINMEWNYTKGGSKPAFTGILLQEIDRKTFKKLSPVKKIFLGSDYGFVEGPHIYKKGEYYYLFCAEGGTSYRHAEVVARSKNIWGPYEIHPNTHIIKTTPGAALQKTGHASIVDGGKNGWLLAHLCGRPNHLGKCNLGRETALQNIIWDNDWPYLNDYSMICKDYYELKQEVKLNEVNELIKYDLNSPNFKLDFKTLRKPMDSYQKIVDNKLMMVGLESLLSWHNQNIILRRQSAKSCAFGFKMHFNPESFQELAGLTYRYQEGYFYALYSTLDYEENERFLCLMKMNAFKTEYFAGLRVKINEEVFLKCEIDDTYVQFYYSNDGIEYKSFGEKMDNSFLSDEDIPGAFTGAHLGMFVCDLANHQNVASFSDIWYQVFK